MNADNSEPIDKIFEFSVTLGDLLQAFGLLAAVGIAWWRISHSITMSRREKHLEMILDFMGRLSQKMDDYFVQVCKRQVTGGDIEGTRRSLSTECKELFEFAKNHLPLLPSGMREELQAKLDSWWVKVLDDALGAGDLPWAENDFRINDLRRVHGTLIEYFAKESGKMIYGVRRYWEL